MIRTLQRWHRGASRSVMDDCEDDSMILQPGTTEFRANGTHQLPHVGRSLWRRGRLLLVLIALLVVSAVALVVNRSQSATPASPVFVAAPLVAHGQVMPARQAHVGTQSGGVVQRLGIDPGAQVTAQTPLATIVGASSTEFVTAPFGGT